MQNPQNFQSVPGQSTPESIDYERIRSALENFPHITDGEQGAEEIILKNKILDIDMFAPKYRDRGIDLDRMYHQLAITKGERQMSENFMNNRESSGVPELAELLPLLANRDGRLGRHCKADIVKTAKQDDMGNSFVDIVCTLKLDPEIMAKDKELSRLKSSYTFMVDTTTSRTGLETKEKSLAIDLDQGKMANVLSYEDSFGRLGRDGLKCLVFQDEKKIHALTQSMQLKQAGGGVFNIGNPNFDARYREYFSDFLQAVMDNMSNSISYLKSKGKLDDKQKVMLDEYQNLSLFLGAYKNSLGK